MSASDDDSTAAAPAAAAGLPAWDGDGFWRACAFDGDLARVRELTSPEHIAAHSGVDLNGLIDGHATGLYYACRNGHIEVVRYLTSRAMLEAGVDVNKGSRSRGSPLAIAAFHGRVEVVRHLLESPDLAAADWSVDVNAVDGAQRTVLHKACEGSAPVEVVAMLLRQPQLDVCAVEVVDGKTALQVAETNTESGGRGAKKAVLVREAMRLPMARRYVLAVALLSRREGRAAAPALPGGTLDEEDEEARGRRRVMGGLPRFMLETVCRLASQ